MTIVIPAGFLQVTLNYGGPTPTGKAAVVLGFTIGTAIDEQETVNRVQEEWITQIKGSTCTDWALESVVGLSETMSWEGESPVTAGTRGGDPMPPSVSVLMRKNTSARGRANQGRSYWPGMLLDGDVDGSGNIGSSRRSSIFGDTNAFFLALEADGINQVILHNNGAIAPTSVETISIEGKVATQRRRLR